MSGTDSVTTDGNVVLVFTEGFGNDAVSGFDASAAGAQEILDITATAGASVPLADVSASLDDATPATAATEAVVAGDTAAAADGSAVKLTWDNGYVSEFVIF